jgi:hypothetical protein
MSAAYKTAILQTFCVPVCGTEDTDAAHPQVGSRAHPREPVQGWEQWARDVSEIVAVCEMLEAINLVQDRNRELLKAMSRERPDLYAELGTFFTTRRNVISHPSRHRQSREKTSGKLLLADEAAARGQGVSNG